MADILSVSRSRLAVAIRGRRTRDPCALLACGYGVYFVIRHTPYVGLNAPYLGMFALGALGPHRVTSRHCAILQAFNCASLPCALIALLNVRADYGVQPDLSAGTTPSGAMCFLTAWSAMGIVMLLISAGRTQFNRARALLSGRPLVFLGTFAYSIYLIHVPIQQLFWQYALRPLKLAPLPTFGLLLVLRERPLSWACVLSVFSGLRAALYEYQT